MGNKKISYPSLHFFYHIIYLQRMYFAVCLEKILFSFLTFLLYSERKEVFVRSVHASLYGTRTAHAPSHEFLRALSRRVMCANMESANTLSKSYTCIFWNSLSYLMKIDSLITDVSAMVSQIRAESEVFGKFLMYFGQIGPLCGRKPDCGLETSSMKNLLEPPPEHNVKFFALLLAGFGQSRPLLWVGKNVIWKWYI